MAKINTQKQQNLSHDYLLSVLHYDPITGNFTWLVDRTNKVKKGKIAGYINIHAYHVIRMDKNDYQAHRLAWFYMTSEWPSNLIDHINRVRNDNRWCNLREANLSQNAHNKKMSKHNKSNIKGLFYNTHHDVWCGRINYQKITYEKNSKIKQVVIDWLDSKRAELHEEFANNGNIE